MSLLDQRQMLESLLDDLAGRWQLALEDTLAQGARPAIKLEKKESGDVEIMLVSDVQDTSGFAGLTFNTTLLTLKELETVLQYIKANGEAPVQVLELREIKSEG